MRLGRWSKTGVWQRVFEVLAEEADNEYAMIDSTIVRAHQHSAGVKGGMQTRKQLDVAKAGPAPKSMQWSMKKGNPVSFHLTPGLACDARRCRCLIA